MAAKGPTSKELERLRGSLPRRGPGARGLEQLARNSRCVRLQVMTAAGVAAADVAAQVYHQPGTDQQSPFAIDGGNRFEKRLVADEAARLVELLRQGGELAGAVEVIDLEVGRFLSKDRLTDAERRWVLGWTARLLEVRHRLGRPEPRPRDRGRDRRR